MKATVFCTPGQASTARRIKWVIGEHGDLIDCRLSFIAVEEIERSGYDVAAAMEYIGYLNAARRDPRETLFRPGFACRYPILRYLTNRHYGGAKGQRDRGLPDPLLPAVALDNRMIMMPLGAFDLLKYEELDMLKSKTFFGISEVDFASTPRVRQVLSRRIDTSLELLRESVRNYRRFHGGGLDPERIAGALEITTACARRLCSEVGPDGTDGEFGLSIRPQKLAGRTWQRLGIRLANRGSQAIDAAYLLIDGPLESADPPALISVKPGQTVAVPIYVRPMESGCYPIEVKLKWHEGKEPVVRSVGIEWICID